MIRRLPAVLGAVIGLTMSVPADASSLQVAPVLLDVALPAAASSLRLKNLGTKPITAQVRVYRWSQSNGQDQLSETRDVVASPPFVEIGPEATQLVRIVRVTTATPGTEQSYRLLIDEIPEQPQSRGTGVNFAVRYSIPVFFAGSGARNAPLAWSVEQHADRVTVAVNNPGSRRVRIAALRIADSHGGTVGFGNGLVGYVLGGATVRWSAKGRLSRAAIGSAVAISANTDNGPLQATGTMQAPR